MRISLSEKKIGSYWVFPVLDDSDNLYRITLIIQVGTIKDKSTHPILSESVAIELIDSTGRPLDLVDSPEGGEFEIRGGPSLQSTAKFAFCQSDSSLKQLNVSLNGETVTFDTSALRGLRRGFSHQPEPGDKYPVRRPPENVLEKILRAIPVFFLGIAKFFKRLFDSDKCCLDDFDVPEYRGIGVKRNSFDMNADFDSSGEDCACECCVYRQYVRGVFRNTAGNSIDFQLPDGLFNETVYLEDGIPNEWGSGEHGFYGHRERPAIRRSRW